MTVTTHSDSHALHHNKDHTTCVDIDCIAVCSSLCLLLECDDTPET